MFAVFARFARPALLSLTLTLPGHAQIAEGPERDLFIFRAMEMAVGMDNTEDRRTRVLNILAETLVVADAAHMAEMMAWSEADPVVRRDLMTQIALAFAETGQHQAALRLAADLLAPSDTKDDAANPDMRLIEALALAGDGARAVSVALSLTAPGDQLFALNTIAPHLTDPSALQTALRAALALRDPEVPLAGFIAPLFAADRADEAMALFGAEDGLSLNRPVAEAGAAFIARGEAERALALTRRFQDPTMRRLARVRLLSPLLEAGEVRLAGSIVEETLAAMPSMEPNSDMIGISIYLANVLPELPAQQALTGLRQLEAQARAMQHPGILAQVGADLALMGHEEAAHGAFSEALRLASMQETERQQAGTLVLIARELHRANRITSADEFLRNARVMAASMSYGAGSVYVSIARAEIEAGRSDRALQAMNQALDSLEYQPSLTQFVVLRDAVQLLAYQPD